MKNSLFVVVLAFVAIPAFAAKELKCRATDSSNKNPKSVVVVTVEGAVTSEEVETEYGSNKITVVYNKGDKYESQTVLTISVNNYTSQTYNVSEKSLYQMMAPGLFLQCSFQ